MTHPITSAENFSYSLLNKELEIPKDLEPTFSSMLKAYNHDFWQNGKGSLLPPPVGAQSSLISGLFEKRFVFRNVLRECMERVSGSFYGKAPNWKVSKGSSDSIEKALGEAWTKQDFSTTMASAFESRLTTGRGGIRVYVPEKYARTAKVILPEVEDNPNTQTVRFTSIEDALKAIRIEYISPDRAKVLTDDGELFSILRYKRRRSWTHSKDVGVIEFSFVDDNEMTFIGKLQENESPGDVMQANLSTGLDLGGNTTFVEIEGAPYASPALYKNNQLLNLALTCAGFSLVDNGFGETFFTNVDVEMEKVDDPSSELGYRLVPKNMIRGGGVTQNLIGIAQENPETGAETRTTPGVHFREPSAVTVYKDGKDLAYTACLEETGQLYAKLSGDAVASGESRIQAMTDYWMRIRKYKPEVDEMGSRVLTVVLRLAAALCGQESQFSDQFVTFDSKIFIGQTSADERRIILEMKNAGTISRETAGVLMGVDDPTLEADLIQQEQKENPSEIPLNEFDRRLDLAMKMQGTFDQVYILNYLGITDEAERNEIIDALAQDNAVQMARMNEYNNGPQDPGATPPTPDPTTN